MKVIHRLIIIGAVFSFVAGGVFLIVKSQVIQALSCVEYPTACSSNATQRCVGNSVFWYDSCGKQQSWIKDFFSGSLNGECIDPQSFYVKHFRVDCSDNNLYWRDSNGAINDLYKNCSDNNECTKDRCSGSQCLNEGDCEAQTVSFIGGLDVSSFCGVKDGSINLSRNITLIADQTINCLIVVKNISTALINDVTVRTDIPAEIVSASEVKIDGMISDGNIISGINLGNFPPNASKIITFEGKTQPLITQVSTKQITGIISFGSFSGSDSLVVNFQPTIAGATTTASLKSSLFVEFFKRWYIWILLAIVLIFLFFVIFRRLSSNV